MEKIKIQKTIFDKRKDKPFTWEDIKNIPFEDDDVIQLEWVDEDPSPFSGYWHGEVNRMVEETDEELQERIRKGEELQRFVKERRYESYLKLKKEFETE